MAQAKKYGAFSGVFTPSILTILGVIMYMRLPWITGQAGLYMVLGIIFVAHIVSICTGLSVSSIATDKKVEGGGSYYIISRSLGLSIGGTLGIALFFGLSFSVSLYVIGFSESFNSYWGIENSVNAIRLTGSVTLLLVTILTFISTSLALRLQFFILAAIGLSLLSVFFGHSDHTPTHIALLPQAGAPSMMVLFGIFFPAVTGFEAGVSMSGDLKDPKNNIPKGTITAILVGLVVYAGLPFFLLYRVSPSELVNNPNILLDISLFPPLVIAGVWSATVSSAIGSILGAPRILQATAVDKITPKFLAKGSGKQNEPRNALLLTFVIAEAGILIGELDIIARVVSTFFITTYGFLNVACTIERWASSDFRPSFKVPKWVSILGFITCLVVMIQLDLLAMIGGIVILGGLLFFLKQRELTLKSGDAWESVWLSVVRMGLLKLSQSGRHQRNWKPNILLFSGGTEARPHLISFGKWVAGKLGMVSNFDLIERPSAKELFPRTTETVISDDPDVEGVFIRRQECRDVYEGIDTIARTYGFSGIEPNAVLMGWRKKTKDPERFVYLINKLKDLDVNLMLMNFKSDRGFGSFKTIDIWWRGAGNNGNFTLALLTFIRSSLPWRECRVRFLIVVQESALVETVYKNMARTLQDARFDGEIKVISNAADQRPIRDIITAESAAADLTILGLPDVTPQNAGAVVENTNAMIAGLGTTLLVHASSFFNEVATGIGYDTAPEARSIPDDFLAQLGSQALDLPPLVLPADEGLKQQVITLDHAINTALLTIIEHHILSVHERNNALAASIRERIENTFDRIGDVTEEEAQPKAKRLMAKVQGDLFFQMSRIVTEYKSTSIAHQKDMLDGALSQVQLKMEAHLHGTPEMLTVLHGPEEFKTLSTDPPGLRLFKGFKRLGIRLRPQGQPSVTVRFRSLASAVWDCQVLPSWLKHGETIGVKQYGWIRDIQNGINAVKDALDRAEARFLDGGLTPSRALDLKQDMVSRFESVRQKNNAIFFDFIRNLFEEARTGVNRVAEDGASVDVRQRLRGHLTFQKAVKHAKLRVDVFPHIWMTNQDLLTDMLLMDLQLMSFKRRVHVIVQRVRQHWFLSLENGLNDKIERLIDDVRNLNLSGDETFNEAKLQFEVKPALIPEEAIQDIADDIEPALSSVPESARALTEYSLTRIKDGYFTEMEALSLDLRELLRYLVYADFLDPLRHHLDDIPSHIETLAAHVKDAVRFLSFGLSSLEGAGDRDGENDEASIQEQCVARIEKEMEAARSLQQDLMDAMDQGLKTLTEKINPYLIISSSAGLRRYIRYQESKKVLSVFGQVRGKTESWIQNRITRMIYARAKDGNGLKRPPAKVKGEPGIKDILAWLDRVTPPSRVLPALPFHYKQLFLSDQPPGNDLWVGRNEEMIRAQAAVDRFKSGTSGALMITGERFSGKSALSHRVAQKYFDRSRIFQIFPQGAGSCRVDAFHRTLEKAFQARGPFDRLFHQIPHQSAVVIHDLELLWERHPGGLDVIETIEGMIRRFGHQCFFILNMNSHALTLLRKLRRPDDYFLDVIACAPLTAEELKNVILMRHNATGLRFQLGDQSQDMVSELGLARLFRDYYGYSKGNVGVALKAWLGHMTSVGGDVVKMVSPVVPDPGLLSQLSPDKLAVLIQCVLHKTLDASKMMRVMDWTEDEARQAIDVLARLGALTESSGGLWQVNPFLSPFLTGQLRERMML